MPNWNLILYVFCVLNKIESQTAKLHGMEGAFKSLAFTLS